MMKITLLVVFYLSIILSSGCQQHDYNVDIIEAEGWTDTMPNARGKTYINIRLRFENVNEEQLNITRVTVKHGEDYYHFAEGQFGYDAEENGKSCEATIKFNFRLEPDSDNSIDARIEYDVDLRFGKVNVDDISIELVH